MRPDLVELRARPEALHLFQGHTLLITAQDGVVRGRGAEGLYQHNTRLLSRWRLCINGKEPQFVAASPVDAYSSLAYYLAADVKEQVPGLEAEEPGLVLTVARFVGEGMHEDVELENYSQAVVRCELGWDAAADFADLTEARGGERRQEAEVQTAWQPAADGGHELTMRYTHPRLDRAVAVRFPRGKEEAAEGPQWRDGCVVYDVVLAPGERRHFCVAVAPVFDGRRAQPVHGCYAFHSTTTERDRLRDRFLAGATRLQTPHAGVQAAWDTAVGDLANLALYDGGWPEVLTPAAGIPAYQALFGRDVLTAAWQAAMVGPVLMEATLAATARHLGTKRDDFYDEQPGRIVQQVNLSPLAMLGITPFRRYYGDFAAPADFLIVLGQYFAWTADADTVRRFYDTAERVLDWLDGAADMDGDGFVEYETRSPQGQRNQGWKDSGMALVYEDGRGVPNPIATCELQGYVYAGKQQYATALALGLRRLGQARQRLFNEAFWMPAEGFFAYALDPQKRQVRSITSNPGHCLAAGIVAGEHAPAVAGRLMAPDMFSGWGIRTLSRDHPAFNPFSYQLGGVWPVENATIAFGLKRYGFHQLAADLARAMFDAAALFPHHRLPEVIGGYQRDRRRPHPGVYPQAQSPQAWSASAVPLFLQALLALRPLAPLKLLFVDPVLPEWLPELTLSNLRVGDARLSLRFHREADGRTDWQVLDKRGTVFVVRQRPESSVGTSLWERATDALGSLLPWLR